MPESDSYVDHFTELASEGIGYLTWEQWDRLLRAWTTAVKHLPWWWVAGHIRGGDADELRTRSNELALGLPATWLAAHEITRLMQELNRWTDLEDAAKDQLGHYLASQLTSEVETAAAKWPMADRTHRVKYFRCQVCQQLTLRYYPPNVGNRRDAPMVDVWVRGANGLSRAVLMDVVVRCSDASCGAVMDSAMFERAAFMEKYEQEQRGKRRVDSGEGSSGEGGQVAGDDLQVVEGGEDSDMASAEDSLVESA